MTYALIVKEHGSNFEGEISPIVEREGFSVSIARDLCEAKRCFCRESPKVVFLDMALFDGHGIDLYESISLLKDIDVILLMQYTKEDQKIRALHVSASQNLVKTIDASQLRHILARVRQPEEAQEDISVNEKNSDHFGLLYGRSPTIRRVYEQIANVAPTSMTVFVVGESGTGKELVAQTTHMLSQRCEQPFIAVNCGAISPQLFESEMFGHEKGSFTGANGLHHGFFEKANGGTLFLDEVTEMSPELQVKFLRVLETGSFMRVGSSALWQTDTRIIAATNVLPEHAVASGKLREDLYYRLNAFPIVLPPLRERCEDIPLLAEYFLKKICAREKQEKYFSKEALKQMRDYDWPGNVRELRNAVERAFIMTRNTEIDGEWCQYILPSKQMLSEQPDKQMDQSSLLSEVERSVILATLERFSGHRENAAAALGVSPKTLYNKLKKYEK